MGLTTNLPVQMCLIWIIFHFNFRSRVGNLGWTSVSNVPHRLIKRGYPVTKEKKSNEEGFIEDCHWVFESLKTGDYHENIDASYFEEWFASVKQIAGELCSCFR